MTADHEIDERCETCGTQLVRSSSRDVANPYNYPMVSCPECKEIVRVERSK